MGQRSSWASNDWACSAWVRVLFAGPTEFEMIDALRGAGLVDAATRFQGLEEYQQHERNAVESCALCRERRHVKREPPPPPARSWRETLYAHPYVAALGLFALFALIGALVSLAR
ncbi:MAG: hypothetical protein SFW67_27560 [Myxococcaceae bacterium]|nr:hypothetical protein [Myxococcaceae bacterium]